MQNSWGGRNRAECIRRIFTEGVKDLAREKGYPLAEALTELAKENPDLWREYCADVVPVQGAPSTEGASSMLATEMISFARENQVSLSEALQAVSKARPGLWEQYRDQITILR